MEYFLERIARSLTDEFGNTLNRHCMVFPGRRAGLYFLKYLAARIQKPVWAPPVLTINELFRSFSGLHTAGSEMLLFELYKTYRKLKPSPESFDDFYFWGEMLLNDFDDIDKYMADACLIFRNINDIKTIDQQFGGLTEAQIEIIRRFWINFDPGKPTNEKNGFISLWSVLYDIYTDFRNSLKAQNLAYEGMIFRDLAEESGPDCFPDDKWDMIHFIGFNALNECEKEIMRRYKKAGKARFYWDYDHSFIKEGKLNSAGFFIRENLKMFGNDMPDDWICDRGISASGQKANRRVIEASSDVAQVKLVSKLLSEIPGLSSDNGHHTAIILADENLLIPVMTSLPENIGDINITMGYPLKQTLVYTLVKHLMDLQMSAIEYEDGVRFSSGDVISVLKHSLIKDLMSDTDNRFLEDILNSNLLWIPSILFAKAEFPGKIFVKPPTPVLLSDYFKEILALIASNSNYNNDSGIHKTQLNIRNECIYRVILSINRLGSIVNSSEINFNTGTYIRILDRMLRIQSVPFSGEPLSGIQIMGILETRTLDFRNLIILSVNEGMLPAVSAGSSFIPVNLREAFGLPSVNHQESIYAYYFYRLLQRSENVTFTYNSNSEGLRSGEMSRFLIQLKYENGLKPDFTDLSFEIKSHLPVPDSIDRTDEHILQLSSQFLDKQSRRVLSPSAVNTWLSCRMKFFFRYVSHLKEPQKISSEIDPAMIGNILHDIMKSLYSNFINQVVTRELIEIVIFNKPHLQKVIDEAIGKNFYNGIPGQISGNGLIMGEVIMTYLLRVLYNDRMLAPFIIKNLEDSFSFILSSSSNGFPIEILTGGKIDRIDAEKGITRIVDYKTGTVSDTIGSVADLFIDDRKKDCDGWLQTLIYCEAYLSHNPDITLRPAIYKIKKMTGGTVNDNLKLKDSGKELVITDYRTVRSEFMDCMRELISKIFSKDEPFTMTSDLRGKCTYCPYKGLCLR
jgi:hypothetical protein